MLLHVHHYKKQVDADFVLEELPDSDEEDDVDSGADSSEESGGGYEAEGEQPAGILMQGRS